VQAVKTIEIEMKKSLFLLLKLAILIVVVFWLFKIVDFNKTIDLLSKTILSYFALAFLFHNSSNFFITLKWYKLAKPLKLKSSYLDLLKLNFISMFYSIFVPGQGSGELIKGIKLQKKEGDIEKVWAPIFIDKITNLLVMLIIGATAILFDQHFNQNKVLVVTVFLLIAIFIFLSFILFTDKITILIEAVKDILVYFLKFLKINTDCISNFSLNYFNEYKNHKSIIFETFFWSFMTKLPHVFALYFLAKSLNIDINLIESAWLLSVISIASLLPISFSGLGVREGTLIFSMSKIGVGSSEALSFSLLIFILGILTGLIGGIFELKSLFKKQPEDVIARSATTKQSHPRHKL
jgi:uncharacterized protein (TIRG00374 family)